MYCSLQRVAAVLQTACLYYSRSSILTEWDHTLYTHSFAETSYWQFVCTAVHQVRTGYCLLYYTGHLQVKVKVWHRTDRGQRNGCLTVWSGQIYDLCRLKIKKLHDTAQDHWEGRVQCLPAKSKSMVKPVWTSIETMWTKLTIWNFIIKQSCKIPLAPMGVLAPVSAHARPSTQPPIGTSGIFPARVSAESPSNISPNPSKVTFYRQIRQF